MFALGIQYLTGQAVSTEIGNRDAYEWPPHPARVFMALVAACQETDRDDRERDALLWLEGVERVPALYAAPEQPRRTVTQYVPVNDRAVAEVKKEGAGGSPLSVAPGILRRRASRTFPSCRLEDDRVFLIWNVECPPNHHAALEKLCRKVTRIGHSSSLVQMWIEDAPPPANWLPADGEAEIRLRSIGPGLVEYLEEEYAADPPRRPRLSVWQGYTRAGNDPEPDLSGTIWEPELLVRTLEPQESGFRHLDVVSTLALIRGMHQAVVSRAREPVPEVISGHQPSGAPSEAPHLAFFPLAFVGRQHADGLIRGVGIALPRRLGYRQRREVLAAVGAVNELRLGRLGRWKLGDPAEPVPQTLRSSVWTGERSGARVWGTVTPIAFDRHPKPRDESAYHDEVGGMIHAACRRIGLPEPVAVAPLPASPHLGTPAAHEYPRLQRKDGSERRHLHAWIAFAEPVRGPIAVGAGRYRGYGFLRPLSREEVG